MPSAPITVKLRCASWRQLASIYRRDLSRSSFFLKSAAPPPVGTRIRISLTLPSESLIILTGQIREHVPPGGMNGRGPGIDIALNQVPHSVMWLIETALSAAGQAEGAGTAGPPADQGGEAARRLAQRQAKAQTTARLETVERAADHPGLREGAAPAMEDGIDLVAAEDELLDALRQELASLRRLNAFQVLGVGYGAGDDAVRRAFGELTKRYHPDRFARYESQESRELASEIFIIIRNAYRRLVDERSRARVLASIKNDQRMVPPAAARPARPAASPAAPASEGASPGKSGKFSQAERLIEQGQYDAASRIYGLAAKRDPQDRDARAGVELCQGLKALAQRDRLEAAQRFEAVLELDPSNERAARELAEMRRKATNERKGLLSRLLGKSE